MSTMDDEKTLVSSKPHVMFISFPLQGHISPMVQFSKRLVSKGIKVTVVTTTSLDITNSNSINIEHILVDTTSQGKSSAEAIDEYLAVLETGITESLPEVIEKQTTEGWPVKFLIYDALMPYALEASQKVGVQGVAFCTHSSAVLAIYYHVYQRTLDFKSLEESSSVTLPSLPLLGVEDLPSYLNEMNPYTGLFTLCMKQFRGLEKAYGVMFNTFEELEGEVSNFLPPMVSFLNMRFLVAIT